MNHGGLSCCDTYATTTQRIQNRLRTPDGGRYVTAAPTAVTCSSSASTIALEEQEQEGAAADDDHKDCRAASPVMPSPMRLSLGAETVEAQAIVFRAAPLVPPGLEGGRGMGAQAGPVPPSVLTAIVPASVEEKGLRVVGKGEVRLTSSAPSPCVFPASVWRIELLDWGKE